MTHSCTEIEDVIRVADTQLYENYPQGNVIRVFPSAVIPVLDTGIQPFLPTKT
ncbi:hypothetical protein [Wolbachia endosymbiont of Armadillidium arcangelii]|uniref:GGDEF domain-containing protein n=1 Tax=Wolbachia endosymbiont of Armadillidium arcangelii TaxID=3158571 RepID=A0AAU7Q2G0_9RICK